MGILNVIKINFKNKIKMQQIFWYISNSELLRLLYEMKTIQLRLLRKLIL